MILEWVAVWLVLPILSISLLLGFIRLARGPSLPDRVVAFELIIIILVGIIIIYAMLSGHAAMLDVASVWAVISFLSVIAIAWYIERWRKRP